MKLGNYSAAADIAGQYGVTADAVKKAAQRGAVKAVKVANRWFIDTQDAARYWGRRKQKG